MKRIAAIAPLVCVIPFVQSCSAPSSSTAWSVQPTSYVRHSVQTPEAYYQLGRYYQGQNRLAQAIQAFEKALAIDRNYAEAYNALGAAHAAQGQLELAIEAFGRAIAIAPGAAHFHNNLGYARYLAGRLEEAVQAFKASLALDAGDVNALNNLGLAYAKLQIPGASRDAFARAAAGVQADPPAVAIDSAAGSEPERTVVDGQIVLSTQPIAPIEAIVQPLALPKDRGIIRFAEIAPVAAPTAIEPQRLSVEPTATSSLAAPPAIEPQRLSVEPVATSSLELVQLDAKVFELRRKADATVPVVAVVASLPAPELPVRLFHLEVSNGNGVPGMARRVSRMLAADGLPVARLTNQKPYRQRVTQVLFRSGFEREADWLSASLPNKPVPRKWTKGSGTTDVRVVLGKDVATSIALDDERDENVKLAAYERLDE